MLLRQNSGYNRLPSIQPMIGCYKYERTSDDYLILILPTSFQIPTCIAIITIKRRMK